MSDKRKCNHNPNYHFPVSNNINININKSTTSLTLLICNWKLPEGVCVLHCWMLSLNHSVKGPCDQGPNHTSSLVGGVWGVHIAHETKNHILPSIQPPSPADKFPTYCICLISFYKACYPEEDSAVINSQLSHGYPRNSIHPSSDTLQDKYTFKRGISETNKWL